MSNNFKNEMNKIKVPANIHTRSKAGVEQVLSEIPHKSSLPTKGILLTASLLLIIGAYAIFNDNPEKTAIKDSEGMEIYSEANVESSVEFRGEETTNEESTLHIIQELQLDGNIIQATITSDQEAGDQPVPLEDTFVQSLLSDLNKSIPVHINALANIHGNPTKIIHLELHDNTIVSLRIFKNGYVQYADMSILYKIDAALAEDLWP